MFYIFKRIYFYEIPILINQEFLPVSPLSCTSPCSSSLNGKKTKMLVPNTHLHPHSQYNTYVFMFYILRHNIDIFYKNMEKKLGLSRCAVPKVQTRHGDRVRGTWTWWTRGYARARLNHVRSRKDPATTILESCSRLLAAYTSGVVTTMQR